MSTALANDVLLRAQAAMAASPVVALRDIQVQRAGVALRLSGRVTSYYHKQLAQEVVRGVAAGTPVENAIEVDEATTPHIRSSFGRSLPSLEPRIL